MSIFCPKSFLKLLADHYRRFHASCLPTKQGWDTHCQMRDSSIGAAATLDSHTFGDPAFDEAVLEFVKGAQRGRSNHMIIQKRVEILRKFSNATLSLSRRSWRCSGSGQWTLLTTGLSLFTIDLFLTIDAYFPSHFSQFIAFSQLRQVFPSFLSLEV